MVLFVLDRFRDVLELLFDSVEPREDDGRGRPRLPDPRLAQAAEDRKGQIAGDASRGLDFIHEADEIEIDGRLADLLEAILTQSASKAQTLEFQDYVRAGEQLNLWHRRSRY